MGQVATTTAKERKRRNKAKNQDVKTKAAAPGAWVTALLHGKTDGTSVMLEFRSGRQGAPMLVEAVPFLTLEGVAAHESVIPLAVELWNSALEHRAQLEGERYDYRIRIVSTTEDGGFHSVIESPWIESPDTDGDILGMSEGGTSTENMYQAMIVKLFSSNIALTRASAALLREYTAGSRDSVDHEMEMVQKVKQMAMEVIEREREFAKEEADAKEVEEFGKTARQWMQMGHLEKMAKQGIKTPTVPKTRKSAAKSLYASMTVGQLELFKKELGEEKAELLIGLIRNAGDLKEEDIEKLLKENFASDMSGQMEMMSLMEKVFAPPNVPKTWAIWQAQTAGVLINGPEDKADDG